MANNSIGDSVYSAGPFFIAHVDTALATLKPVPVTDSIYAAASFSAAYVDTDLAVLKATPIDTFVFSVFAKSIPSSGQIWPRGI